MTNTTTVDSPRSKPFSASSLSTTSIFMPVLLLLLSTSTTGLAQEPVVPRQKRVVDEVTLATGQKVYGIVTEHNRRTGTTILVERAWLKQEHPAIYAEQIALEREVYATFSQQHLDRLKDWKRQRPNEENLNSFLDEEIEFLEKAAEQDNGDNNNSVFENRMFTKVKFEAPEVSKSRSRPDDHHQVAGLAWKYQLRNVSTRSMAELEEDLVELGVDIANDTFDLSIDLPPTSLEPDQHWNARVCIFEYALREQQHYQGTGSVLIKVTRGKRPAPEDLIKMMTGGGLGGGLGALGGSNDLINELLEDLQPSGVKRRRKRAGAQPSKPEEEFEWAKSALAEAEKSGHRAVRVTRLTQNMANPIAQVDEYFFAEITPGKWQAIFTASENSNRNELEQAELDFLKADPQVKQIVGLFNGTGALSDQTLDTAMRQGAATLQAMTKSSDVFFAFIHKYTQRTDGPAMLKIR